MECIICRKEKDVMSDEHVIPDSLGGFYHIKTVCISCNSTLGGKVDAKLVNHAFSKFMRFSNNLKGKTSTIPNPLAETYEVKANPEQKVRVQLDENNKPSFYRIPNVKYIKDKNGVIESIQVSVDSTDKNKLEGMISTISKRLGVALVPPCDENTNTTITQIPELHRKINIDIKDFHIGMLKIAYEFAVDTIPEYYETQEAKSISNALYKHDLNLINENVFAGSGFDTKVKDRFNYILDISAKKHYLFLTHFDEVGLVCMIFLHDLFSMGIKLASNKILENSFIVGVNDIDEKKFTIYSAEEAMAHAYSRPEIRFEYNPSNKGEAIELIRVQNDPNFEFYKKDGEIPLFNKYHVIQYCNAFERIDSLANQVVDTSTSKSELKGKVTFNEELYVKLLPSNNLYRVTSAQVERYLVNKI